MPRAQSKNGTRSKIRNSGGLSYWKRKRKMEERLDEVRYWFLRCHSCEHSGGVEVSLRKLRAANLICSECGVPIRRR